jgi:hypothetical protein
VRYSVRDVKSLSVVVLLLLTGCTRGPVLSESVEQLHVDARAVSAPALVQLGAPGAHAQILEDRVQDCGDGLSRQTYRMKFPVKPGTRLSRSVDVAVALVRDRGYRLDRAPKKFHGLRRFTMTRETPAVQVTMNVRRTTFELAASTPCLPPR